jgi:hypothetical protein
MAQEVRRFSIESDVKLPPVAVVAASYMLENQDEFVSLDEMLLCTARGAKAYCPGFRTGESGLWRYSPPAWWPVKWP